MANSIYEKLYISTPNDPQSRYAIPCDTISFSLNKDQADIIREDNIVYSINIRFVIGFRIICGIYTMIITHDALEQILEIDNALKRKPTS